MGGSEGVGVAHERGAAELCKALRRRQPAALHSPYPQP